MTVLQSLAVAELRRWCYRRHAIHSGRTTTLRAAAHQPRDCRTFNNAHVQSLDFEKCFSCLPTLSREVLLLRYRDKLSEQECGIILECSPYTVHRLADGALEALAYILDRAGLLA